MVGASDTPTVPVDEPDPTVYDHFRPTDVGTDGSPDVEPGVYRVVGAGEGTVTLLRVGDAEGRRVYTGRVVTADPAGFEPADNPDGNRTAAAALVGAVDGAVWQARTFARGLAARPLPSLVVLAGLVVGYRGDRVLPGPDIAFTVVFLLSVLALVALGSRGGHRT